MAIVAHPILKPYVLKTASVKFAVVAGVDTDDFSAQLSAIKLTPTTPTGTWVGITGNVQQDQGKATWTAQFGAIQDLDTTGFLRWLLANEGKKAVVTAILATGGGTITTTVTLAAGEIGGEVGPNPMSFTVPMACDGTPTWV